jgi:hypothetical protein
MTLKTLSFNRNNGAGSANQPLIYRETQSIIYRDSSQEDQRFELVEPEGRVFKSPKASLRFIKKGFRQSEKGFGQQPVDIGQMRFLVTAKKRKLQDNLGFLLSQR